jgi:hypothetical protein
VSLFRRGRPLHERLADDAGLDIGLEPAPARASGLAHVLGSAGFLIAPPDVFGNPSPLGQVAFHGVARPRRWDVVASAETDLPGTEVHFVALPDGMLLVDENVPDGALMPLADAVEQSVQPPYRAVGVRRGERVWAVAAARTQVRELPGEEGDELERVEDGVVLRGRRLDGDLWEVEETPL